MKPVEFERQLQRQPLRTVPAEWRSEILRAARAESRPRPSTLTPRPSWLSTLNPRLSTLLWPCPEAWAAMAAIWVASLVLHFNTDQAPARVANQKKPTPPEAFMAFAERRELLSELLGSSGPPPSSIEPPKPFTPRPQSSRRQESAIA